MMSAARYKPYPAYKPSGVEWLGDIPEGWEASKIKYQTKFQVGWTPPTKTDENFLGSNLWANISDLGTHTITDTAKRISDLAAAKASMSITPSGSLLYSFKLSVGTVSFAGTDMFTNEAIASFLPSSSIPLAYLYYALPIFLIQNASTNIYGARILNQELIRGAAIATPPFATATKIAAFLDYETAKIDALIAKQQRLIALLEEKRQAVISHAVTKGLDPTAPLRPSGIDWLGDVPAHWDTPNLFQTTTRIGDGLHSTPVYEENTGYFFVNGNNLNDGEITTGQNAKEVPESQYHQHFIQLGRKTVLMSINGTIGKLALYRDEPVILGKSAAYINCSDGMMPEFLFFYLGSSRSKNYYDLEVTGTTIFNLSLNSIRKMKVCLPPLKEQDSIAMFCKDAKQRFDTLLAIAQTAITLLKERRTALISGAVTGKIDLRGWQPPAEAANSIQDSEVLA